MPALPLARANTVRLQKSFTRDESFPLAAWLPCVCCTAQFLRID